MRDLVKKEGFLLSFTDVVTRIRLSNSVNIFIDFAWLVNYIILIVDIVSMSGNCWVHSSSSPNQLVKPVVVIGYVLIVENKNRK